MSRNAARCRQSLPLCGAAALDVLQASQPITSRGSQRLDGEGVALPSGGHVLVESVAGWAFAPEANSHVPVAVAASGGAAGGAHAIDQPKALATRKADPRSCSLARGAVLQGVVGRGRGATVEEGAKLSARSGGWHEGWAAAWEEHPNTDWPRMRLADPLPGTHSRGACHAGTSGGIRSKPAVALAAARCDLAVHSAVGSRVLQGSVGQEL